MNTQPACTGGPCNKGRGVCPCQLDCLLPDQEPFARGAFWATFCASWILVGMLGWIAAIAWSPERWDNVDATVSAIEVRP